MHDANETKLAVVDDNQQFLGVLTQDRLARGIIGIQAQLETIDTLNSSQLKL